jgi:hypothetical protein
MAREAKRGVEVARDALRRADDALAAALSREALRDDDGNADAWSVLGIALRRSDAAFLGSGTAASDRRRRRLRGARTIRAC